VTAIRKHLGDFAAVIALLVIALLVAGYILHQQRLRFPFIQKAPYTLKAEFTTAQAVTPGQGQTVRVSGVQVGDISGVALKDGHAVVTMSILPEYKGLVHTDATALLRPKTGLKDMFIEINPGPPNDPSPLAKPGWTLPISSTLPDINPDEIYAALDSDSRAYLKLLVQGAGQGLNGRGHDLQQVFARFEPTHRDLARLNGAVATRATYLRDLIHQLNVLNGALAGHDRQLSTLVSASSTVFHAFAQENGSISRFIRVLPPALTTTTTTLGKVQTFANQLTPTAISLQPVAAALDRANHAAIPFAREATPEVQGHVRPFVRELRPLIRQLRPAARNLDAATPNLTQDFFVLNRLLNMFAYNPNGGLGPVLANQAPRSYLFYLAWLGHIGMNLFSTADAHGSFRPVTEAATCNGIKQIASLAGGQGGFLATALNLTPLISDPQICP